MFLMLRWTRNKSGFTESIDDMLSIVRCRTNFDIIVPKS